MIVKRYERVAEYINYYELYINYYYHYYYYHYLASELSNDTSVVSSSSIRCVLVDWLLCILYPQFLFLRQLSPSAIFFRKFSRTEVLQKATNLILVCKNRQSPLHYRSRSNHWVSDTLDIRL